MVLTVILMACATAGIGLLPTASHTSFAIALLVLLRLLQGFSASGEHGSAVSLLYELAPDNRKGLFSSIGIASAIGGVLLGSIIYTAFSHLFSNSMLAWAWRLPFLLALPFGIWSCTLRYKLLESEIFLKEKADHKLCAKPFVNLLHDNLGQLISLIAFFAFSNIGFNLIFVYLANYLVSTNLLSLQDFTSFNMPVMILHAFAIVFFGFLSDYFDCRKIMLTAIVLIIGSILPFFIFSVQNLAFYFWGTALISFLIGMFTGGLSKLAVSSFPTQTRATGLGFSLNIGASLFGGTCPMICALFVKMTGNPLSPAFYFICLGLISIIALIFGYKLFAKSQKVTAYAI